MIFLLPAAGVAMLAFVNLPVASGGASSMQQHSVTTFRGKVARTYRVHLQRGLIAPNAHKKRTAGFFGEGSDEQSMGFPLSAARAHADICLCGLTSPHARFLPSCPATHAFAALCVASSSLQWALPPQLSHYGWFNAQPGGSGADDVDWAAAGRSQAQDQHSCRTNNRSRRQESSAGTHSGGHGTAPGESAGPGAPRRRTGNVRRQARCTAFSHAARPKRDSKCDPHPHHNGHQDHAFSLAGRKRAMPWWHWSHSTSGGMRSFRRV